jgi:hypothetical protein
VRVFRRLQLLQNSAARKLQTLPAGFHSSLLRRQARIDLTRRPGILLLQFNRLTLPSACHTSIISLTLGAPDPAGDSSIRIREEILAAVIGPEDFLRLLIYEKRTKQHK